MNPADAERKKMRQKEILRNKRERQFLRDASKKRSDPAAIRAELQVSFAATFQFESSQKAEIFLPAAITRAILSCVWRATGCAFGHVFWERHADAYLSKGNLSAHPCYGFEHSPMGGCFYDVINPSKVVCLRAAGGHRSAGGWKQPSYHQAQEEGLAGRP